MKKDFDEKALLGLYTDYDNNIRPYFNKPFEVDGAVVATDAHMIIVLDRKSLKGNYSGNEVAPYVMEKIREIISTPVNCNKTVGREELERALSALPQVEETVEEYKTETCPECAGTGIVEWSYNGSRRYYSHESECPECDGDGVVTNEYKRKTGRMLPDENAVISFYGIFNILGLYVYTLLETMKLIDLEEALLLVSSGNLCGFSLGNDVIVFFSTVFSLENYKAKYTIGEVGK